MPVRAPESPATFQRQPAAGVDDVDVSTGRARRGGASVEREPADQLYGRAAVIVDPFGHRWILLRRPARATRLRQGDVADVTMVARDTNLTKELYAGEPARMPYRLLATYVDNEGITFRLWQPTD